MEEADRRLVAWTLAHADKTQTTVFCSWCAESIKVSVPWDGTGPTPEQAEQALALVREAGWTAPDPTFALCPGCAGKNPPRVSRRF